MTDEAELFRFDLNLQTKASSMTPGVPIVFIVDDDMSVRESIEPLVLSEGWDAQTFASAKEFLAYPREQRPGCLILDVTLPDLDGLALQQFLARDGNHMPIVFITGYGDIPMTVRAMKAGAVEFLTKPLSSDALLTAVRLAIGLSQTMLKEKERLEAVWKRYRSLTHREREVLELVVAGLLNKQVAAELGISEITVKAHRGRVMGKMAARSFAELVTMSAVLRGKRAVES